MNKFFGEVWYELRRSFPRTWYFIKNGHLHPEVQDRSFSGPAIDMKMVELLKNDPEEYFRRREFGRKRFR